MQPNRPEIRRDLSLSNGRVGDVESARGNLDAALSAFRECLGIFRELVCLQPDRPVLRRDLSVSLQRVGDVESARGNLDAALSAFQESVGIFRELVRLHPDQPEFGNDLSSRWAGLRWFSSGKTIRRRPRTTTTKRSASYSVLIATAAFC